MRSLFLPALLATLFCPAIKAQDYSWEERALRQLNKKVTVEFVDSKLSDACSFVSNFTGVNIIVNPKVLKENPTLNFRVKDMDAGTVIKWLTQLTSTYAEVADQAIYITDKPSEEAAEGEKNDLMLLAASVHAEIDLPPKGVDLTDAERVKIALKLIEKMEIKPTDFPGPDFSIGTGKQAAPNPFGAKP